MASTKQDVVMPAFGLVATKKELQAVRTELKGDLHGEIQSLRGDMEDLRHDVNDKMDAVYKEVVDFR